MRLQKFKIVFRDHIKAAKALYSDFDIHRACQVLSAQALAHPKVIIETFSKVVFNLSETDFAEPKAEGQKARMATAKALQSSGTFRPDDRLLQQAKNMMYSQLKVKPQMFKPISANLAADLLPKNTSTGAWWFGRPKGKFLDKAVVIVSWIISNRAFDLLFKQAITYIAWRTQERQSGTKFRQIFVLPYIVNIVESMFCQPLFSHFSTNDTAYSFNTVWTDNAKLWKKLQNYEHRVSFDSKTFDRNVSNAMIAYTMQFTKSLFSLEPWEAELFDTIIRINLSAPVVTSVDGKILVIPKQRGVFSGSVFTNYIDSVICLLMTNYCLLEQGINPLEQLIKVKGDDIIMGLNAKLNSYRLISTMSYIFGNIVPLDDFKSYKVGEHIYYLGYKFTDTEKLPLSLNLLIRKIAVSGRFIPEDEMDEKTRVISKICSVLSNVSNGYYYFKKYFRQQYLDYYGLTSLPKTFFDLAETEIQSFSLTIKKSLVNEMKYGWRNK